MTERDYTFNVMTSLIEESRVIHLGDGCSMFDAAKALTDRYGYNPCPMCDVFVTLHKLDMSKGTSTVVASVRGQVVWRDKVQGSEESIVKTLTMHNLHPPLFENIFAEMNRQQSDVCFCITELNSEEKAEGTGAAAFLVMTLRWLLSQALNTNIDMLMCNIGLSDCLFDSVELVGEPDPVTKVVTWRVKYSDDIFDSILEELNTPAENSEEPDNQHKSHIGHVLNVAMKHMDKAHKLEWAADIVREFEKDPNAYIDNVFTVWEASYVKMLHILNKCGFKRSYEGDLFMRGDRSSPVRFCYALNYRKDFDDNKYFETKEQSIPVQAEIVLGSDVFDNNNPDW